jgi:bifunctional DNA-binding transcriptional regulator/antitoxin component of YhaV-PrlF toxin-antitoxin module
MKPTPAKYTHLSPQGQVTIPVRLLRQLGWQPGTTKVLITLDGHQRSLVIRAATARGEETTGDLNPAKLRPAAKEAKR